MRRLLQMSLLVLALASCSKQDPASVPPPTPPTATPTAAAPPVQSSLPAPPSAAAEPWLLALDGEGLRIFNSNTGASRLIAFGEDATQSLQALGRVLDQPLPVQVQNEECQVEFARFDNGLTVWSSRSRFAGWSVTPGSSSLATASGIKIGSSRAELEGAYDAQFMESSLGTEFLAGKLAGLLDSGRPDAKISNLWAGDTCIAR